jgi:hypothetical protein
VIGTDSATSALADEFARRGIPLTVLADHRVDAFELFGADVVLVRPDQHIAWLGLPPTAEQAAAVLDDSLHGFTEPQPTTT